MFHRFMPKLFVLNEADYAVHQSLRFEGFLVNLVAGRPRSSFRNCQRSTLMAALARPV